MSSRNILFGDRSNMKIEIDEDLCIGDGICEEICPEVFELTDNGIAKVIEDDPDQSLEVKIEEAAEECPTDAIIIDEYGLLQEEA
jgi:ferredoxin